MKKNIHSIERAIRVGAGVFLVSMVFWGPENMWFMLGLIPLMTGLIGWCPPYAIFGINTCNLKSKH